MNVKKGRWWRRLLWVLAVLVILIGAAVYSLPSGKAKGVNQQNSQPAPTLATSAKPTRILVIGGTSGIGLEVVKLAAARGHTVTVMARHAPAIPIKDVRFVMGDVLDAAAVAAAMQGQEVVVNSISAPATGGATTVFSKGMTNVLTAMHSQGVSRLIAVTGMGAGDSRKAGGWFYDKVMYPVAMASMYDDKTREEQLIKSSSLDWTIVRPGVLGNGPAGGQYWVIRELDGVKGGGIARADVAAYMIAALENGLNIHEAVVLSD